LDTKIDTLENIPINENLTTMNMSEFTLNRNDNDFLHAITTCNNQTSNSIPIPNSNQFLILETKLEDLLTTLKENKKEDKFSLLGKKNSIMKKIFEEYINIIPIEGGRNLLGRIYEGYDESMNTLMVSFSKVNEKLSDYETLTSSNILNKIYFRL
jgi:hypothetical protein